MKWTVFVCVSEWKTILHDSDKCLAPMQKHAPTCTHNSSHTHHRRVLSLRGQDVFACFQVIKAGTATVGQKEDGGLQSGIGTCDPGPDPTVLTPALGEQTVISGFLRDFASTVTYRL